MTDERSNQDEATTDAPSPEEWIDRLAESKGRSRAEVLEELISSHWTLQEMLRLVEQSEEGVFDDDTDGDGDRGDLDILGFRSDLETDLQRLEDQIESLDAAVTDASESDDSEELRAEITDLNERVQLLEASLAEDTQVTTDDLQTLDDQFSRVADSLTSRHEHLRSHVNDEFVNLETILEYLIEATDRLDRRTASLSSDYHSEVDSFVEEHRRLADLKRDATRLGITTAECEYCSTAVDIAMLPSPSCPQCDRSFDEVVPKQGWNPFGSPTLSVTGRDDPADSDT